MYAIVEIAGQQFKVQKDQKLYVHRLAEETGAKIEFDKVLLVDNDGVITLGAPAIEGAKVTAEVLGHVKGDKVIVSARREEKATVRKTVTVNFSLRLQSKALQLKLKNNFSFRRNKKIRQWHIKKEQVVREMVVNQQVSVLG